MDIKISKEKKTKVLRKRIIRFSLIIIGCLICTSFFLSFINTKINHNDLQFSEVDKGRIELSVTASGKIIPASEEIINSPINSRILEVYKKGGDSVNIGTPILKLDLISAETDYKKLIDEEQMRRYQLEQLKVNNQTYLSDLKMNIKVNVMELNRMKVELKNERYLDSLGSGTTDKVHQAELAYETSKLELEQLKQQYQNEVQVKAADLKVKELEFNIFKKSMAEMKRTLDDAQIRSPRKAILTYIDNQVGAQIQKDEKIAVISDLSHFKVDAEISDSYGNHVSVGGRAIIKIGSKQFEGVISNVTPLSKNGVISFTVQLNNDNDKSLRSGLQGDVYVMNSVKDNVLRINNASYYIGPGEYKLFVLDGENEIVKRKVMLGESNFEKVEVISGLKPGDKVVTSDMSKYTSSSKLKIK